MASWTFSTLDLVTMRSTTDPYPGFLPPNEHTPDGQGSICFNINLKEDLPHGTVIRNKASIYSDVNPPIITNTWSKPH